MSYGGNGVVLGIRCFWVEFYNGVVMVALRERMILSRDLKKSRGLIMGIFEVKVSG